MFALRSFRIFLALLAAGQFSSAAAVVQTSQADTASSQLTRGKGSFIFQKWQGPPLQVHYYVPADVKAETPITFVMHGKYRDAERYLGEWVDLGGKTPLHPGSPRVRQAPLPREQILQLW